MRWTVVVPGGLLPSAIAGDVLAGATAPWLARVLARAQAEPAIETTAAGAPHLAWLWQQHGGAGEPVTAPYALRACDEQADAGAQCWHIDAVHFRFARDRLLVALLDEPPDAGEEAVLAGHLRAALDERAADDGARLHRHGGRWWLTLQRPWAVWATPLDGALGQSADEHWPAGAGAAAWRRLLTDVQMRWHQEPLNERREASGRDAVNALWLHGGGAWAPLPRRPYAAVADDDPVLRGWALAAGVPREALLDGGTIGRAFGDAVSIRRDLLLPAQFGAWGDWLGRLQALEAALQRTHAACFAAGFDELELALCGRRQVRLVRLRRGDNWRLWRQAALAPLLAEAE